MPQTLGDGIHVWYGGLYVIDTFSGIGLFVCANL